VLGNYACRYIIGRYAGKKLSEGISKIHGRVFFAREFKIIAMYHPAVAVYNPRMYNIMEKDFLVLSGLLRRWGIHNNFLGTGIN
jgi:uracil-DNA glycosylase family 4